MGRREEQFFQVLERYPDGVAGLSFAGWDFSDMDLSPPSVTPYAKRVWNRSGQKRWFSHGTKHGNVESRYLVLASASFRGCSFRNASLVAVRFDDCDLSGCDFTGADLSYAVLDNANVEEATFVRAVMFKTCVERWMLHGADFTGTDLSSLTSSAEWGRG